LQKAIKNIKDAAEDATTSVTSQAEKHIKIAGDVDQETSELSSIFLGQVESLKKKK